MASYEGPAPPSRTSNVHIVDGQPQFTPAAPVTAPVVEGPPRREEYERGQTLPTPPPRSSTTGHPEGPPVRVVGNEEEHPTESHALANAEPEIRGVAQLDTGRHGEEVKDLGWNEHPRGVPSPLVGGLPNEELWTLVRRFNKVCGLCK